MTSRHLRAAAARLASVSATPRLDAEILLAHALGVDRGPMLIDPDRYRVPSIFAALVDRRMMHEPIAYIVGYRDFWTVRIDVGPGALVPRADSETLIDAAVAHFGKAGPARILDLGTGPGTLLLAALAEWPVACGLGVDRSEAALDYARANAASLGMANRAEWRCGDWGEGVGDRFDLILCNPPYIGNGEPVMAEVADHEPADALFAGDDGLAAYRRIIPDLARLMNDHAIAIVEIGWTQADAVTALAQAAGFIADLRRDLAGRDRALVLRRADGDA